MVSGNPDIGGSRASLALMAAEELGIDYSKVRPIIGDTSSVGYNFLTGGSRVTFATGLAVVEAARDAVRQMCERAAKIWEVEVDGVIWRDGHAVPASSNVGDFEPLSLADIAAQSPKTGGPICGHNAQNVQGAGPGFATHICDVEVDPETGRVTILRYTAVQDVGRAIHPSYVEGQIQGGAVQGIGWALNEEYIYNDRGQLENPGFLDYRIPVASDLPMIETVVVEVPNDRHPYGGAWRRRGSDRPADGGGCQCDRERDRCPDGAPADVAAATAGSTRCGPPAGGGRVGTGSLPHPRRGWPRPDAVKPGGGRCVSPGNTPDGAGRRRRRAGRVSSSGARPGTVRSAARPVVTVRWRSPGAQWPGSC